MHAIDKSRPSRVISRRLSAVTRLFCGLAAMGLPLVIIGSAIADYDFTQIDGANPNETYVLGINNGQPPQFVGYTFDDDSRHYHGFLADLLGYGTIDVPDATDTVARGINDAGQIVGRYTTADGRDHGFMLSDGAYTMIDAFNAHDTWANGINNAGQIVGTYDGHGFLLSNGQFTTIDVPNSTATYATGINDDGLVVGYFYDQNGLDVHGFLATPR